MGTYIITTDSASDLPESYIQEHHIYSQSLFYSLGGTTYGGSHQLDYPTFYQRMRNGEMPITNAIIPAELAAGLEPFFKQGLDILHIAFSSALSASYQNAVIAANELMEQYPDRKMLVVDSRCASLGQGLLVHKALQRQAEGLSLEENAEWVTRVRDHICHQFTVDDLNHLQRGGRVSKAVAVIGTIINIKPVLHVNPLGELKMKGTTRGRKKSLIALVDAMGQTIKGFEQENDIVFISHGDSLRDAHFVEQLVRERFGISSFLIDYVSPTIGAHSGPGTIALFYYGSTKEA